MIFDKIWYSFPSLHETDVQESSQEEIFVFDTRKILSFLLHPDILSSGTLNSGYILPKEGLNQVAFGNGGTQRYYLIYLVYLVNLHFLLNLCLQNLMKNGMKVCMLKV